MSSDKKELQMLQVGAPYIDGKTQWEERVEYNFRDGGHELRMFLADVSPQEIEAIARGPVDFGLLRRPILDEGKAYAPIIFFLYQFAMIPWSDTPFTWWMVPEDQRTIPAELHGVQRPLLHIVLVDAKTGIVKVLRVISLQPQFAQALHGAIRQQAELPFDQAIYDSALDSAYTQFRTTIAMMRSLLGLRQMHVEPRQQDGLAEHVEPQ